MTKIIFKDLPTPNIPVSWGELIDKICILEIKQQNASNELVKTNVSTELVLLNNIITEDIFCDLNIKRLRSKLKKINQNIWDIEDEIRSRESAGDFGKRFIELARNTLKFNDERAKIKKKINIKLNSEIVEEKLY